MARTNKAGTGGQLPRKDNDIETVEGIAHDHDGRRDLHRRGDQDHEHGEDGRPIFAGATDQFPAVEPPPAEGFGEDQFGTDPDTGAYHEVPQPAGSEWDADAEAPRGGYFNGDHNPDRDAQLAELQAESSRLSSELAHRGMVTNGAAQNGPPGHSIGDVLANDAIDTALTHDDREPLLKQEMIYTRLAANTLLRMTAEFHRYNKVADAELLMALRDQVEQLVVRRGSATTAMSVVSRPRPAQSWATSSLGRSAARAT
jgi:hypothetical protein